MKSYFLVSAIVTLSLILSGCSGFSPSNFVSTDDSDTTATDVSDTSTVPSEPVVIDADLQAVTDTFMALMVSDAKAAFASTHELFKQYTNEQEFLDFMVQFPIMQGYENYDFYNFSITDDTAEMYGTISSETEGTYDMTMLYDKNADGAWEISGFDIKKQQ